METTYFQPFIFWFFIGIITNKLRAKSDFHHFIKYNKPLILLFVDFEEAFDSVQY